MKEDSSHIGFYISLPQIEDNLQYKKKKLYFEKCCKNLEDKINGLGGIAKKNIKIFIDSEISKISPEKKKSHFLDYLKQNNSIHIVCNLPYADYSQEEKLKKNYIVFDDPRGSIDSLPNVFDTYSWPEVGWRAMLRAALPKENIYVLINSSPYKGSSNSEEIYVDEMIYSSEDYIKEAKDFFNEFNMKVIAVEDLHFEKNTLEEVFQKHDSDDYLIVTQRIFPVDKKAGSKGLENIESNEIYEWYANIYKKFLKTTSKCNLIALDLSSSEKREIFNYDGSIFGKRIISMEPFETRPYLRVQDFIYEVDPQIEDIYIEFLMENLLNSLESIELLHYIFSKSEYKYLSRKGFVNETIKRISFLDGNNDIFIGNTTTLSFNGNKNIQRGVILYENKRNSPENNSIEKNMFRKQISCNNFTDTVDHAFSSSYANIDVIKLSDISIENGTFQAKFFFELTTPYKEAIDIVDFNNSTLDSDSSIIKVSERKIKDDYLHFRYLIEDTFSFEPIPDNYPFDTQLIYISYSILSPKKFGVIQPIDKLNVDTKFQMDGWNIHSIRAGIFRQKFKHRTIISEDSVEEGITNRVGWIIERSSSMTLLKILIPLSFLWLLVLYGLFLPIENLDRAVGVITTAFLSGIALYFSTERPQPLRMTVIDIVFTFFYSTVGIASIAVFTLNFFPAIYNDYISFVKYLLPITILLGYVFLKARINSKRFFPRMSSE